MLHIQSLVNAYSKVTLCIHPDKVQQKGATLQQKYIAEKVFDLLKFAMVTDIRVKEPTLESLASYMFWVKLPITPLNLWNKFHTAISLSLGIIFKSYTEDTECVGFARLGSEDPMIVAGTMKQLQAIDFGAPLHCLVITGRTHPLEEEMLDFYRCRT
ncbi:hypothetical protein RIF29_28583 [Crotalaria pallida]|uniref:Uncharacterized protein n=1 Tax=Crotalaria pallida TaxID=3830 RepID=A0AAN9ED26_CROPI